MKRVRVKVFGDVQGIGFRHYTRYRAIKLGVNGLVRNNVDKTVEAVFEGEDEKVDNMVEFCRRGPPSSHVEHVDIFVEPFKDEFRNFSIV